MPSSFVVIWVGGATDLSWLSDWLNFLYSIRSKDTVTLGFIRTVLCKETGWRNTAKMSYFSIVVMFFFNWSHSFTWHKCEVQSLPKQWNAKYLHMGLCFQSDAYTWMEVNGMINVVCPLFNAVFLLEMLYKTIVTKLSWINRSAKAYATDWLIGLSCF